MKRTRRTFDHNFKKQVVELYLAGKSRQQIMTDFDISQPTLSRWISQHQNSKSFKHKDNLTPEQIELINLRKQNKQLVLENEILKQAALILRQR